MKRYLAVGSALIALAIASPSEAADLRPAYKAPPAPVAPIFSWTGFYIGLNVGGAWGTTDFTGTPNNAWLVAEGPAEVAFLTGLESPSHDTSGITVGGQIGYNYQIGNFVWGVEGDVRWMDLKHDLSVGPVVGPFGNATVVTTHAQDDWLATFRGRLGWAAWDRALLYVTGGLAVANVQDSLQVFRPPTGYNSFGSIDTTSVGWTVGGGIEYAFAPNWSVKGEYLFVDLGDETFSTTDRSGLFPTFNESVTVHTKLNIATVGVNYRF